MIRSTRVQKAERLRAARRLRADEIGMAEAAMALSREFGLHYCVTSIFVRTRLQF